MSLPRSIKTRLLESLANEAKACMAQPSLGLAAKYAANGKYRIYPWPVIETASIKTRQINIVVDRNRYAVGGGGVSNVEYGAAFSFLFPPDINESVPGENTYGDEVAALRAWLLGGGTVPNESPGRIVDPDWSLGMDDGRRFLTTSITEMTEDSGLLSAIVDPMPMRKDIAPMPQTKAVALYVNLHVTFLSREDRFGNRT